MAFHPASVVSLLAEASFSCKCKQSRYRCWITCHPPPMLSAFPLQVTNHACMTAASCQHQKTPLLNSPQPTPLPCAKPTCLIWISHTKQCQVSICMLEWQNQRHSCCRAAPGPCLPEACCLLVPAAAILLCTVASNIKSRSAVVHEGKSQLFLLT